jgi:hypothetical protein
MGFLTPGSTPGIIPSNNKMEVICLFDEIEVSENKEALIVLANHSCHKYLGEFFMRFFFEYQLFNNCDKGCSRNICPLRTLGYAYRTI